MTFKYDNVYINETSTITGPYESEGPFSKLYDKSYNDFYFKRDSKQFKYRLKWRDIQKIKS